MPQTQNHSVFAREMAKHDDTLISPDGRITATVKAGNIKSVAFRPNTYSKYTETELEAQLVQLAKLVWVSRERARRHALQEAMGTDREIRPRKPSSSQERRVVEQRDKAQVEVRSANITIRIKGGLTWAIRIKPGTIRSTSEEQFLREFAPLVKNAIANWLTTVNRLRREAHGPSEILRGLKNLKKK